MKISTCNRSTIIWFSGIMLTTVLIFQVRNYLVNTERTQFHQESYALVQQLSSNLFSMERASLGLASILQFSPKIYPDDFRFLAQPYLESSFISSVAYIPKVPVNEKEAFEQLQAELYGLVGFKIRDFHTGQPLSKENKQAHFPILWLVPRNVLNLTQQGRDLNTCEPLRIAMQQATRLSAVITVSNREKHCQKKVPCEKKLIEMRPVYHGRLLPKTAAERHKLIKGFIKLEAASNKLLTLEPDQPLQVHLYANTEQDSLMHWGSDTLNSVIPFSVFTADYPVSGILADQLQVRITKIVKWSRIQYVLLTLCASVGLLFTLLLERFVRTHYERIRDSELYREEIEQRETLLRTVIETIPDLVWLKDPNGVYLSCNHKFERLFAATQAEIIGKTDYDFVDKKLADFFREHDKTAIAADMPTVNEEEVTFADDGHTELLETIKTPVLDSDGKFIGVLGIARDITGRKKAEIVIRKSAKLWDRTFNSFTDIVTIQDTDMNIVKINQAGCDLFNLTGGKIIGKSCHQLFQGSSEPCPDCPLLVTQKTFEPYRREMTHKKMGKTFLVSATPVLNDQGNLLHIAHVAKDITDIKKSEEDRIRLTTAIDQTSEAIVITDAKGNIQYINPAFENITGYKRAEAIGQNPRILKSGRHDRAFYEKMWTTLLQGKVWKGHLINRKKDGSLYEEETTISPVKNRKGEITNFVAVKYDVSREISLEKQLRQAMKMEAIGTLAGGIAHDFNNILAAILGYGEMARAELADDAPIARDLDQIIIAGKRATELVKQILTFSRQGEEDLKPLKIQLIIKEALKLLRSSLPTTIQLKQDIADDVGLTLADPTQMHQVLMNLCTNAKHAFDADGGTLSISLAQVQITDSETIAACPQLEHGSYLDLAISDTGCGMDALTCSRIFDPFFTTKEKGKGTGLGLAVAHGIIKQHNGEITVTSELGQGTTFHVYLPIIEEEIQTEKIITEDIPRGNERILLVDDETAIVELLQRMLTKLGYTVTVFTSSIEALAAYEKNPDNFDLVITDMTMPNMTGIALAKKLFALRSDLPVILCTGFSEIIDEEKAKAFGIREYIMKPVIKRTLAEVIRKALM